MRNIAGAGERPPPATSEGDSEVLMKRVQELQESHEQLSGQLGDLFQERGEKGGGGDSGGMLKLEGGWLSVLQSMGHAVHVHRPDSGEIVFWNNSAEKLYGWKGCEVLGQIVWDVLFDEENKGVFISTIDGLLAGQSWSGRFPMKRRSGEVFNAMITTSLMYEDGELTGVITVSSDADLLNNKNEEKLTYQDRRPNGLLRDWKMNLKSVQWHSQPQIASSVTSLASKLFPTRNDKCSTSERGWVQIPPEMFQSTASVSYEHRNGNENQGMIKNRPPASQNKLSSSRLDCEESKSKISERLQVSSRFQYPGQAGVHKLTLQEDLNIGKDQSGRILHKIRQNEPNVLKIADDIHKSKSFDKGEKEQSSSLIDCEIQWQDLYVGEEVGQGSFGVVHRGIWNGSDVVIKIYTGSGYREGILQEYKKEITIMKRLRHPNVLLFMGAVYSPERLAIVTEYLPRGSLDKILQRSPALDIRRRIRMAVDVARGMNYLHKRNPPIVHRDLKSSNLLVDRNWTVKVGNFGLSQLKKTAYLSAESEKGTPQWMAPEVLRNEPSNENSDVFSFGVILWELMTGSIPWNNLNTLQVVNIVGFMDRRLELPKNLDSRIASMINDCWQSEPDKRPTFQSLLPRMTELLQYPLSPTPMTNV